RAGGFRLLASTRGPLGSEQSVRRGLRVCANRRIVDNSGANSATRKFESHPSQPVRSLKGGGTSPAMHGAWTRGGPGVSEKLGALTSQKQAWSTLRVHLKLYESGRDLAHILDHSSESAARHKCRPGKTTRRPSDFVPDRTGLLVGAVG